MDHIQTQVSRTQHVLSPVEFTAALKQGWEKMTCDVSHLYQVNPGHICPCIYVCIYCRPCITRRDNIYCQQVVKTNTFTRTYKTFKKFCQLDCKFSHLIYSLQLRICQLLSSVQSFVYILFSLAVGA